MEGGRAVGAYLSLRGRGGRLFEAGRLLTFSAFRMGAYSRWAPIRGWALIRINKVFFLCSIFLKNGSEKKTGQRNASSKLHVNTAVL